MGVREKGEEHRENITMADTDYVVAYINKTTVPDVYFNSCVFVPLEISRFSALPPFRLRPPGDAAISLCPLGGVGRGDCAGIKHLLWAAVTAELLAQSRPRFKLLYLWVISCPALTKP